jgi:predicted MFS family arabinose efflux permease
MKRQFIPGSGGAETCRAGKTPLPLKYWLYWVMVLLVEAIEFCIILWAAAYLETVSGLSKANAAMGMSVFMGAMLVGRVLVSRLLQRSHEQRLLLGSLILTACGFILFWFSPGPFLAILA